MTSTHLTGALLRAAVVLTIAAGSATIGLAQGRGGGAAAPAPVRVRIVITQVRPDMAGIYQDLVQNVVVPGLKKAGQVWQWTYATGPVGQAFTFVQVSPVANYAQFDQPGMLGRGIGADGVANFNAKIRPAIVSQRAFIQTLNANMSIRSNATAPPPLVQVQDFMVLPGKNQEFAALMSMNYIPALKKAGVREFWTYVVNIGGPGGQVSTVRSLAKYAELDPQPGGGNLVRGGLTQEAATELNNRRNTLISGTETNVYRYVPELSFGMPPN